MHPFITANTANLFILRLTVNTVLFIREDTQHNHFIALYQ